MSRIKADNPEIVSQIRQNWCPADWEPMLPTEVLAAKTLAGALTATGSHGEGRAAVGAGAGGTSDPAADENCLPLCPQWLDNPGNFPSIPPPPPSVQSIPDPGFRQRADDAWLCAYRLRKIIDVWSDCFHQLATRKAGAGAADRLWETASFCAHALWDCGAEIPTLRRNAPEWVMSMLPDFPWRPGWENDQQTIATGQARLRDLRLVDFQGELMTFMTQLAHSPSTAFVTRSPMPRERADGQAGAGPTGDQGEPGQGTGEDSKRRLSPRQESIMETMLAKGAVDRDRRISRALIVQAINPKHKVSSYRRAFDGLADARYTEGEPGAEGGIWLTPAGRERAEEVKRRNDATGE
jgi:hypothetical protein